MPKCGSCGSETTRIRTKYFEDRGVDECPHCAPESFEKFSDPSTRKIWIGPEFAPNDYERVGDSLQMKPEAVEELESKSCGVKSVAFQQEQEAIAKAEEHKRAHRRTRALSPDEIAKALQFVDATLRPMIEDPDTAYEV